LGSTALTPSSSSCQQLLNAGLLDEISVDIAALEQLSRDIGKFIQGK
jgi:hypothetical protein